MIRGIKLVSLVLVLAALSACGPTSAPVPTPKATRTAKPTFTSMAQTPGVVARASATPAAGATKITSATLTARPGTTPAARETAATAASTVTKVAATGTRTTVSTPTATSVPTPTPSPTATAVPTETPVPTATPLTCPAGYGLYTHPSLGFSACRPDGWTVSEEDDALEARHWVIFQAPGSNRDTGEGFKLIGVSPSANTTGNSGDEFLGASALALIKEYSDWLVEWPYALTISGRDAVEANFQMSLPFQSGRVTVVGWKAFFLANDQQWLIQAMGRSEYRDELQGIHDEFLARFLVPG